MQSFVEGPLHSLQELSHKRHRYSYYLYSEL